MASPESDTLSSGRKVSNQQADPIPCSLLERPNSVQHWCASTKQTGRGLFIAGQDFRLGDQDPVSSFGQSRLAQCGNYLQ